MSSTRTHAVRPTLARVCVFRPANLSGADPQSMVITACTKGLGTVGSRSQKLSWSGAHTVKLPMRGPSSGGVTASASGDGRGDGDVACVQSTVAHNPNPCGGARAGT